MLVHYLMLLLTTSANFQTPRKHLTGSIDATSGKHQTYLNDLWMASLIKREHPLVYYRALYAKTPE